MTNYYLLLMERKVAKILKLTISTELIINLDQELAFLHSSTLADKPKLPYKKSIKQKPIISQQQSQNLQLKGIELVKHKAQKSKLTFMRFFISLLVLIIFILVNRQ